MDNKERLKERLYEELKFLDISKKEIEEAVELGWAEEQKLKKTSDKKAKKF